MTLDRQLSRLSKILVDNGELRVDVAQAKLRALTLEIVVGDDAICPASHAAILTAVSVGHRTFVGGVRVTGAIEQPLNSALPLSAATLNEACVEVGASNFEGIPSRRIVIGTHETWKSSWAVAAWWKGWQAGTAETGTYPYVQSANPLVGIAAGALAVGKAFDAELGRKNDPHSMIDLWPTERVDQLAPEFHEVYLPGAIWLIGLGNLGQAYLWALAALPYADPSAVSLVLQDYDRISEENWATSVLVKKINFGSLKTRIAEAWALAKGFDVRRIDRRLVASDRLENGDPCLALSGLDKVSARKNIAGVGFECIVDAGLGRSATQFDRYRVTLFDRMRPIDQHFADQEDTSSNLSVPAAEAYQQLEQEIGRCGTAQYAGASTAAPYVSALASSVAIARLIAIISGCKCPANETGYLSSLDWRKLAPFIIIETRGLLHAGRPILNEGGARYVEGKDHAKY